MKKYILISIIASSVFLMFCSKKNEEIPKAKYLTAKSWVMSSAVFSPAITVTYNGFPVPISDVYSYMSSYSSCATDDFTTFKTDGIFVTDQGADKCDSAGPQTTQGNWSLNSDETKITVKNFNGNTNEITMNVVEISENKLLFSYPINSINDIANTIDTTGMDSLLRLITIKPGTVFTTGFKPR